MTDHVSITVNDIAASAAFRNAIMVALGLPCVWRRDDAAPGLRPHHHAAHYGAFLLDPDGNRIEAVWHLPCSA